MSHLTSKVKKRWIRSVYSVILNGIKGKLKAIEQGRESSKNLAHYTWRKGFNLYMMGDYIAAFDCLETMLTQEGSEHSNRKKNESLIHQTAGRCAIKIFLAVHEHTYLERAYIHYQNSIESLARNRFTKYQLPAILLEFGRVLEYYGAFEAANEVYGRILSGFPNFRGYFEVLYRSAVVGRHLAYLMIDTKVKEESLNRCIDILQFLLEALPATISDVKDI